jgi:hypothetical protein
MESCETHIPSCRAATLPRSPDARELARAALTALDTVEEQVRHFERLERQSRTRGSVNGAEVRQRLGRIAAAARTVRAARSARAVPQEMEAALVRIADPWVMLAPAAQALLGRGPGESSAAAALGVVTRPRVADDALAHAADGWLLGRSWARALALARIWLRDELVRRLVAASSERRSFGVRLLAGAAPLAEYLRVELAGVGRASVVVGILARDVPVPDLVVGWGELDGMVDADALAFLERVHALLPPGGTLLHLGLPHPGELSGLLPLFLDWPGEPPRTVEEVRALLAVSVFGADPACVWDEAQPLVRLAVRR